MRSFERSSPAEQALAQAKENFRSNMLACGPFVELVAARLASKDQLPADLPEFGCEPWRYCSDSGEGNGYGARLTFSATDSEAGLGVRLSMFDHIKVGELEDSLLYLDPLVAEAEATGADREAVVRAANAIGDVYLEAYEGFRNTTLPGDAIAFDPISGAAELESRLVRR